MKNRLKIVMTMTIALLASQVFGQVRIVNSATNAAAINSSAFIDASSNSTTNPTNNIGKGLLFPRTDLTTFSAFSGSPLGLPTAYPTRYDGMIVYNTGTGSTLASASDSIVSVTPGFYYYDNKTTNIKGGKWTRIDPTSTDISKLLVQSPAKDSIVNVISSNGKTLSNGNGILINGGNSLAKSVLADASLRIDSTAIAKMIGQSPVKDSVSSAVTTLITSGSITGKTATAGSLITVTNGTGATLKDMTVAADTNALTTFIANNISKSPIKDSVSSTVSTVIQSGSVTGQNLTGTGIIVTGGTGTSLKATSLRLDSTAIAKMATQSPMKDSIISTASSSITSGLLSGNDLTSSSGGALVITGGTGTSLKATSIAIDKDSIVTSSQVSKVLNTSPAKDSLTSIINNQLSSGTTTGKNTTQGSLIAITNGTGASLKDMTVAVDTIAMKAFIAANSSASVTGQNMTSSSGGAIVITGGTGATLTNSTIGVNKDSIVTSSQVSKVLNSSPAKDSLTSIINNQITGGAITGQNLTAGSLLQTTGTPTGASLKAAGYQVDTTALKTFVAGRTTNTLTSTVNTMTSTTNGIAASSPIVNSVANTFNTTTRQLTTTINGVAGTAVTLTDGLDSTTASNGLTMTGKDVRLGGTLTAATTVAQGANTLSFTGTANTIFNAGNVGIGTATPGTKLDLPSGELRVGVSTGYQTRVGVGYIDFYDNSGTLKNNVASNIASGNLLINSFSNAGNTIINNLTSNVGIGNASPTEKLDVTGNVKFSGALMPNNTAGTAGQVLTSAGAGIAPTWAAPVGPDGDAWGVTGENQTSSIGRTGNVAIGAATPNANAKLDVSSTNQGILVPRVNLTSTTLDLNGDGDGSIANQPVGLLVYNNGTALAKGFYQWTGTIWSAVGSTPSGTNVYVENNDPNSAATFDDVIPVVTNDNSLKANSQNTYYGNDGSVWVWNGTAYVNQNINSNLNVGQMVSTFKTFASSTAANTYLPTTGLIQLDNTIRISVQFVNTTFFNPVIQNISGATISPTWVTRMFGSTAESAAQVRTSIANNAYQQMESNGISYWSGTTLSEVVHCNITLPNGRWYLLEWFGSERADGSKIVYMQATRKF